MVRSGVHGWAFTVACLLAQACGDGVGASASSGGASSIGAAGGSGGTGASASSGGAAGSAGAAGSSPSGEPIPVGDLPGWTQVFADDFTIDAAVGDFPGASYDAGWSAYPEGWHDTSGNGEYSPQKTLSVAGGVLVIFVHTEGGVHWVSAPEPMKGQGQLYGRYSVRFHSTQTTSDYKTAWLLWPDSDQWPDDGEIDFPEGNLDEQMSAFAHYASAGGGQDAFDTGATYASWHTATTEWSPGNVTFMLDGSVIGTSTTMVPSTPMHWVLQTETNLDGVVPNDASAGRLELDWVAVWAKN